jgi:hypothetical protein
LAAGELALTIVVFRNTSDIRTAEDTELFV